MDQPDGLDWRVQFPGLRVGIGELSVAMAAAFLAGGFVVSLVAGGSAAVPLAAMTGAQNPTVTEDSRPGAGITSSPSRPAATRELLVDDLRPVPAPGSGPARNRQVLVDDLLLVPPSGSGPARTWEPFLDDLLAVPALHPD